MLRREELITCGTGARGATWEPARAGKEEEVPEAYQQQLKEGAPRRGCSRGRWHHSWRGRTPAFSRKLLGSRTHAHYQQQHCRASQRCYRPTRPRVLLSLRPVNMMGKRAPGMRAPRNTNQFLMREKYQLMHLRSDSVGTESGGSDSEMDPLDMDSYLGVLENSRGALMDFAEDPRSSSWSPPASSAATDSEPSSQQQLRFFGGGLADVHQEESLQYFPSEDDVIESEIFMEKDFHEFCSRIA